MLNSLQSLSTLLLVILCAGCGDGFTRVQVIGKLTGGGKPLSGTEMFLTPEGDVKAPGAKAFTGPDGSFKLEDALGNPNGVVPGKYILGVHRVLKKDGTPFTEAPKPEELGGIIDALPLRLAGPNSPL